MRRNPVFSGWNPLQTDSLRHNPESASVEMDEKLCDQGQKMGLKLTESIFEEMCPFFPFPALSFSAFELQFFFTSQPIFTLLLSLTFS